MQNRLYPSLVQDAQVMIKELENVTVLWEELWLGTLQDLHAGDTSSIYLFFSRLCCFDLIFSMSLGCNHVLLYALEDL